MTWHGHHHSYQRTCPVYKERCLPFNSDGTAGGPVHLVIGHAGAGLCLNTLPQRPPFWERVELTHGYMRVEANGTDMHCEVGAHCAAFGVVLQSGAFSHALCHTMHDDSNFAQH